MSTTGTLYVVATPIGNLEDITIRAITVLKDVNFIAAEDTRQSKKLLQHYGITTPMIALHAHNERNQSDKIIAALTQQQDVAYITDAGTPLISDPGAYLVQTVLLQHIKVVPIPGPCAAIAALSVAGELSSHFYFEGFLPSKSAARRQRLTALKTFNTTLVFYESPHRILASLEDMLTVLGVREVVIARELTKKFETIEKGLLPDLLADLTAAPAERRLGEFVIVVAGAIITPTSLVAAKDMLKILLTDLSIKRAVQIVSQLTPVNKNQLYELALKMAKKVDN